jgi:hypothetical protein
MDRAMFLRAIACSGRTHFRCGAKALGAMSNLAAANNRTKDQIL